MPFSTGLRKIYFNSAFQTLDYINSEENLGGLMFQTSTNGEDLGCTGLRLPLSSAVCRQEFPLCWADGVTVLRPKIRSFLLTDLCHLGKGAKSIVYSRCPHFR